jgi:uncharacterized protein YndB with AHSA1/START domain
MPAAKRSITIHRPVEEVFAYVADGLNARKWRSGVLDIAKMSGDGKGAIYKQGVKGPMGRRVAADYEITAFEVNRRLAFKAIAGPVRPNGEFTFKQAGDGTSVTFELGVQLSFLRRLVFGRPVQGTMNAEMKALDKLKSNLERGGKEAKPAASGAAKPRASGAAKPAASAGASSAASAAAKPATKKPATARASRPASASKGAPAKPKPTSRRTPASRRTPPPADK